MTRHVRDGVGLHPGGLGMHEAAAAGAVAGLHLCLRMRAKHAPESDAVRTARQILEAHGSALELRTLERHLYATLPQAKEEVQRAGKIAHWCHAIEGFAVQPSRASGDGNRAEVRATARPQPRVTGDVDHPTDDRNDDISAALRAGEKAAMIVRVEGTNAQRRAEFGNPGVGDKVRHHAYGDGRVQSDGVQEGDGLYRVLFERGQLRLYRPACMSKLEVQPKGSGGLGPLAAAAAHEAAMRAAAAAMKRLWTPSDWNPPEEEDGSLYCHSRAEVAVAASTAGDYAARHPTTVEEAKKAAAKGAERARDVADTGRQFRRLMGAVVRHVAFRRARAAMEKEMRDDPSFSQYPAFDQEKRAARRARGSGRRLVERDPSPPPAARAATAAVPDEASQAQLRALQLERDDAVRQAAQAAERAKSEEAARTSREAELQAELAKLSATMARMKVEHAEKEKEWAASKGVDDPDDAYSFD